MFLYAQGSTITCCDRDTLKVCRRFFHHAEVVELLSVDNIRPHGEKNFVASYDAEQLLLVWGAETGDVVSRFVFNEKQTALVWMGGGHVACGECEGH